MKNDRILFLTLHTFSLTGGIEKVCSAFSKVLKDFLSDEKIASYHVLSIYDDNADPNYVDKQSFDGFKGSKFSFAFSAIKNGLNSDVIILSHVHLLIFGWIIKKINPKKRIILFAHGIEIWSKLNNWKTKFIRKHAEILAVSNYTSKRIAEVHQVLPAKIKVLNNCLDPFFETPTSFEKPQKLLNRYHLKAEDKVLFTLSRLSSAEQYKGYDKVIEALATLPENIHYVLAGKADAEEAKRLNDLIESKNLQHRVTLIGFISDAEIVDHYLMADVFAMPSKGEGFGISFIEAAACGRRSITGNQDGSSDAILSGTLGKTVNPDDLNALKACILNNLNSTQDQSAVLQKACLAAFGYSVYKQKVSEIL